MNYNLFGGNAPSPFENPMLKAAGVTAPVVNPIQNAAEVNQANNAAASDPLAIVSAPSAATLKNISALKADSRAPVKAPVQSVTAPIQPVNTVPPVTAPVQPVNTVPPVTAPVQPHALLTALKQAKAPLAPPISPISTLPGMFGVPTSTYVNPILAAHEKAQAASAARIAPIVAAREKKEAEEAAIKRAASLTDLETEQSSRSVLAGGYKSYYDTPQFNMGTEDWSNYQHELDIIKAQRAVDDERTAFAENYKVTNALPFDMTQVFDDTAEGDARADYLNAFTTTEEFANNYNNFKEDFKNTAIGQGASENDMKRAFATANGIFSDTKTYHIGDDGIYTYKRPKRESGFSKIVKGGIGIAFTYVGGSLLAPAFAGLGSLSVPATNAIAQATVNGVVTAAQGGDLSDVVTSGVLGGVGKYATGLSEAAEAATAADTIGGLGNVSGFSDTLGSVGTVSAETVSLAAKAEIANRVVSGLQGIQAIDEGNVLGGVTGVAGASGMFSGDTLSKIETGADTIKAVEDKDMLGAISGGLKLADLKAPQEYAETLITEQFGESEWVSQNIAPLSTASIKLVDELANGESLEDAISSSVVKFAKEGGGLSQLLPEGLDIESGTFKVPMDFLEPLLEAGRQIDKNILQPVKDDVTTLVRETGRTIREAAPEIDLPDAPDLSKLKEALSDFNKEEVKPVVVKIADLINEGAAIVKEEVIDPVVTGVRETGRAAEEVAKETYEAAREAVDPVVTGVRETGRAIREAAPEIDLPSFNFPEWDSTEDEIASSDSYNGLDIDAPELNLAFNARAKGEAQRTANAKRIRAEDFDRLDISNYFSNPLLR